MQPKFQAVKKDDKLKQKTSKQTRHTTTGGSNNMEAKKEKKEKVDKKEKKKESKDKKGSKEKDKKETKDKRDGKDKKAGKAEKDAKDKKDKKEKKEKKERQESKDHDKTRKKDKDDKAEEKPAREEGRKSALKKPPHDSTKRNLAKAFEKESAEDARLALKHDVKERLKKLKEWEEKEEEESESESSLDGCLNQALALQKQQSSAGEEAEASSNEEEENEEEEDEQEDENDHEEDGQDDDQDDEEDEDYEMEESEEEGEESDPEEDEEDEENEEVAGGAPENPHQLVAVARESEKSAAMVVRNSSTHKKEWDCFNRAIQNKKLFPVELSQYAVKSKNDLFAAWLDAKRDWGQCKLIIERRHSNKSESMSGWVAVSGKRLVEEYGQAKADLLMEKRLAAGLYYNHEDFPEDKLERCYYMKKAKEITRTQTVEDAMNVQGELSLDAEALGALINEEDGMMRAGAVPEVSAANAQGQNGIFDEGTQKVAKKRVPKSGGEDEGSKEVKPKTLLDQAVDLMADVLAESTNARKKSMSLGGAAFSGELASQLLNHATTMEKHYKVLQTAVNNKCTSEDFFTKAFAKIQKDRQWFVSAEAAADAILNGLKRAGRPKQKARAKPKAKNKE